MTHKYTAFLINMTLAGTLVLTGCSKPSETDEVEEKAPPNVIQLSPEAIRSVGIQTILVKSQITGNPLLTTGVIAANENRVFHINSFVSGRVLQDNVQLGDHIRSGQVLAVVQNLEVAKVQANYIHELHQNEIDIHQAKTRYQLAQKNLEREHQLLKEGISPRKDYQQALAEMSLAKAELEGKQEHAVHIQSEAKALLSAYGNRPASPHTERITTNSPVIASRGGVITQKNITVGDMVTPDTPMYELTDLSQIWLNITVYPKDLSRIHIGQQAAFTTDSLPNQTFNAEINYLQPQTQASSQTYLARAFIHNANGVLKPGMFGQVQIAQPSGPAKPWIPEAALQKYGRENFVFIPIGQGKYRKQTVRISSPVAGGYQIESGLNSGATVVSQGSFTLKSEMLKGQFAEDE